MLLSLLFSARVVGTARRAGQRRKMAAVLMGLCLAVLGSDAGAVPLRAQEGDQERDQERGQERDQERVQEHSQEVELEFHGEVTLPPRTMVSRRARLFLNISGVAFPYRARTWADHRGRFRFKDVPAGSYSLSIYIPGVGEIQQTVDITESFADRKGRVGKKFAFDQETLQAQTRVVNTGVVSVRELSISRRAWGEFRKAQDRLRDRKVDEAVRLLQRAVELAPQFMEAMNNLGTIYFQKGEFEAAESYFRQALAIEPEAFEPMVNLGGVLLATGSAHEAVEFNQRAQELRPLDALANAQLGLCYFRLGDFGQSLEYLQRTKELDPGHFSNPQLTIARIYLRRSQREAALRELEDFLEQHPDSGESETVRSTIEKIRDPQARSAPY